MSIGLDIYGLFVFSFQDQKLSFNLSILINVPSHVNLKDESNDKMDYQIIVNKIFYKQIIILKKHDIISCLLLNILII